MDVILDTSFIISCVRKRIDFLGQLAELGYTVKVPVEVLQELKDVAKRSKTSHDDRIIIDVALTLLHDAQVKKVTLGTQSVDEGLIAKGSEGIAIATLDAGIKRKIPKKIAIFNSQGRVGVA